jgi:hypothetical protein
LEIATVGSGKMVSDSVGLSAMQKKRWLGELQEMKSIFRDCLPIGDNTEKMDDYFNRLEEVICTNDYKANPNPLRREEFEHDDPNIQYSYLSDALLKERSSRGQLRADGQDVDRERHVYAGQVPQLGCEITADHSSIPECEGDCDSGHWDQDSDYSGW